MHAGLGHNPCAEGRLGSDPVAEPAAVHYPAAPNTGLVFRRLHERVLLVFRDQTLRIFGRPAATHESHVKPKCRRSLQGRTQSGVDPIRVVAERSAAKEGQEHDVRSSGSCVARRSEQGRLVCRLKH